MMKSFLSENKLLWTWANSVRPGEDRDRSKTLFNKHSSICTLYVMSQHDANRHSNPLVVVVSKY